MSVLSNTITFSPYGSCLSNGTFVVWSRAQNPGQPLVEMATVVQEGTWDATKPDWLYLCSVNTRGVGAEKHEFWGSELTRPKYVVGDAIVWRSGDDSVSGKVVWMNINEDGRLNYGVTWNHEQYARGGFDWLFS